MYEMKEEIIKFADISCEEVFACERFQAEYNNYLDELAFEHVEAQADKKTVEWYTERAYNLRSKYDKWSRNDIRNA